MEEYDIAIKILKNPIITREYIKYLVFGKNTNEIMQEKNR